MRADLVSRAPQGASFAPLEAAFVFNQRNRYIAPWCPPPPKVPPTTKSVWLGWAYLTKTMRKPQRGGVNFDPPIICCACSMQNVPTADKMFQMSSYLV